MHDLKHFLKAAKNDPSAPDWMSKVLHGLMDWIDESMPSADSDSGGGGSTNPDG